MRETNTENNKYLAYATDTAYLAVSMAIVNLLHFLRFPLLAKQLGASLFGNWSIMWITIIVTTSVATLGLNMAVIRFLAGENDVNKIRQGFLSSLITVGGFALLCSITLIMFSNVFATSIYDNASYSLFIQLSSVMIFTQSANQMGLAFLRTFRHMKWYAGLIIVKAAVELGLMVLFLLIGMELIGLVVAVVFSDILVCAIAFYISLRKVGFHFNDFSQLGSYLKFGLPLVASFALTWITRSSDRYIIGYFLEAKDVGIYTAAFSLASIISLLLGPFQVVLLPTISKMYDNGNITETKIYLKYTLKYWLMLAIPAAAGIFILADPLLRMLTTAEFTTGSVIAPIIALGMLFYGVYGILIYIFHLAKKTTWIVGTLCISSAINIGLNLLLVPTLGILGAGIANIITSAVLVILTLTVSFRYLKFDLSLTFILKSLTASAVMTFFIYLFQPYSTLAVLSSIFGGIIIYSIVLLLLKGVNKSEIKFFTVLIRERINSLRESNK
jgi:O-antigen/teichoic acid export membrane protein